MNDQPRPLRADQLLSRFGYCSRSEARRWLARGLVATPDGPVTQPEKRIDLAVTPFNGQPIAGPHGLLVVLHKTAGTVCSHDSKEGPSVFDSLPARWVQRNPPVTTVGRLDKDTTGVLIVTDIGTLVQRWTSPRRGVDKVYEVTLDETPGPELIELFAAGTLLLDDEERPCLPAKLELPGGPQARLTLVEGRFHQVKRMFASQGLNVLKLHRSRFGDFTVAHLAPGQWQVLDPADHPL